ncbi:hypothetical protein AgCh_007783 [Apium graveolens]
MFKLWLYGHNAAEYRKTRRERNREPKVWSEVNLTHVHDDEQTLLMVEHKNKEMNATLLLNENEVQPRALNNNNNKSWESHIWYIDNRTSNHMIGAKSKFKSLDESVTWKVWFGNGSKVDIKDKGKVGFRCKNDEELNIH